MTTTTTGSLTWLCDVCRKPVTGRGGFVVIDLDEASTRTGYVPAIAGKPPELAEFHVFHYKTCDPSPIGNLYWFPVDRVATPMDLLGRVAHILTTKDWAHTTNLGDLIYSVLIDTGWRGRP